MLMMFQAGRAVRNEAKRLLATGLDMYNMQLYQEALPYLIDAATVNPTYESKHATGMCLLRLGEMENSIGRYAEAITYFQSAEQMCKNKHKANPLYNNGLAHQRAGYFLDYWKQEGGNMPVLFNRAALAIPKINAVTEPNIELNIDAKIKVVFEESVNLAGRALNYKLNNEKTIDVLELLGSANFAIADHSYNSQRLGRTRVGRENFEKVIEFALKRPFHIDNSQVFINLSVANEILADRLGDESLYTEADSVSTKERRKLLYFESKSLLKQTTNWKKNQEIVEHIELLQDKHDFI